MARVVIHLLDPEMKVLHRLAEREYRPVRSQAAWIIRNELRRLGMIPKQPAGSLAEIRRAAEAGSGGAA